jgi:hypothetical protein
VATTNAMVEAIDELRQCRDGSKFDRMLNAMIRGGGVLSTQMRDEVRGAVYEAVAKHICEGVPSVTIAVEMGGIVTHKIHDQFKNRKRALKNVEFDPDDIGHRQFEPTTEDRYIACEEYEAVQKALLALRDSSKKADRRHFAVLDAVSKEESARDRLRRDFGEELSDDASRHVVLRAREKLRELCGIPKNEKAS